MVYMPEQCKSLLRTQRPGSESMGNSIWLFLAVPPWYFSSILAPFSAGYLTIVPALGTACFGLGVIFGAISRNARLLLFLLPLLLSELYVAYAGLMRGTMKGDEGGPLLFSFIGIQLVLSAYLIYRVKGARISAALLFVFNITYALFAAFIAGMSFTDNWL
jgi:hypothetical protein